jgi:N-acetylglucosamine kinase-like BadF-type ATPase
MRSSMNASPPVAPSVSPGPGLGLGLGLDVGGTQTRWALAAPGQRAISVLAEGQAPGWSGLMLHDDAGRSAIAQALAAVAAAVGDHAGGSAVARVQAGVTGFDAAQLPVLADLMSAAFGLPATAVATMNDIELACHAAFAPGEGFVLYAGTGSVAAFIDTTGAFHRAGGRGAVIDDAGGGHWIASQALRAVWRAEDDMPGAWRTSSLAQRLFAMVGGADWASTRQWVYGASRGELGTLALAVAAAANDGDAIAAQILADAGRELARPLLALARRHGPRPVVLAGRAFELHPLLLQALRAELQAAADRESAGQPDRASAWATLADAQQRPLLLPLLPHHAAARLAAASLPAEPA